MGRLAQNDLPLERGVLLRVVRVRIDVGQLADALQNSICSISRAP